MKPPTILVIEDNPITQKMVRVALQREGYTVLDAHDGASALTLMSAQAPDLVLLDLVLPDGDGCALLPQLRALPGGGDIPILALSGFLPRLEQLRSLQSEFTDYLFKPVEPSRLVAIVRGYLRAAEKADDEPGHGRRVLAVDDDPIQLKLLGFRLQQLGFCVTTAADGAEALDAARQAPPDAIVSDVLMPCMDGFRLCQAVRGDPQLASIPVVLTSSAYTEEADHLLARNMGANSLALRTSDFHDVIEALLISLNLRTMLERPPNPRFAAPPRPPELTEEYTYRVIRQLERQVAINASLTNRLVLREVELAILSGLAESLRTSAGSDTVLKEALHHSLNAAGVSQGAAYLLGPDGRLTLRARLGHSGAPESALPDFFGRLDLLRQVIDKGEPIRVPSPAVPAARAAALLGQAGVRSLLLAPLASGVQFLGVLVIASETQEFGEEWDSFARAVGSQIGQAVSLAQALTQLKENEEQLRQAQKMEAVGRLAGGVAHDFNNLLGAIIGYTDMLIDRMGPDEPWRGPMQEVLKAAERAAVLTRQLLVFSRKDVLSRDVLDLGEIVDGVHKLLRRLIGEDIEMVTVVDPAVGRVEADPGQIEQVLLNLAVNARDAMPCGGKLTIRIENVDPDGASAAGHADVRPGSYVMLTVSDTGCGMDAETQSHIFEPFFTTKERDKGTGLGLATVYAIVGQSEGHIRVDSRPDHGTTFRIYLPRTTEEIRPGPAPDTSAASGGGTETILVAEDEPIVRELVHTVLGMRGYTVLEAIQGDEALRLCEQHPGRIDLLLTDVVMPGMSGRELVTRVVEVRPGIKVLYMSGYTDDAVLRHGVANAQAAFLQKPFTPQVLGGKVRDVLDSK